MNTAEKDAHRSYQDTPYPDFRKHVGIWADLERLRPQGDCVLIRVVPEPEMHANLIWIPETLRGKGSNAPRVGEVVAVGHGDRWFYWECTCRPTKGWYNGPWTSQSIQASGKGQISTFHAPEACPECGGHDQEWRFQGRHPMHVKLGDWVYYWRVFANQVIIQDQVFQFVREEQHILAVIEKEAVHTGRAYEYDEEQHKLAIIENEALRACVYEDDGHLMYDLSKEGKDGNPQ